MTTINVFAALSAAVTAAEEFASALEGAKKAMEATSRPIQVGDLIGADRLVDLPEGTKISDCDGDPWDKRADGWHFRGQTLPSSPNAYGPFTVGALPEVEPSGPYVGQVISSSELHGLPVGAEATDCEGDVWYCRGARGYSLRVGGPLTTCDPVEFTPFTITSLPEDDEVEEAPEPTPDPVPRTRIVRDGGDEMLVEPSYAGRGRAFIRIGSGHCKESMHVSPEDARAVAATLVAIADSAISPF